MNKLLVGVIVGLMIASSTVYFVETAEEFEDDDLLKGVFFLLVAISYILVAIWMLTKNNTTPFVIVIIGSIVLIILYAVTRTDMASIGHLGMVSKTLQVGIVIGSILALLQIKK